MTFDADELLARQLQAEEEIAARSAGIGPGGGNDDLEQRKERMLQQLNSSLERVHKCEDPMLHALALSHMPLDQIESDADAALALNDALDQPMTHDRRDLIAQGLLRWFKHDFFKWVDKPACCFCGNQGTVSMGQQPPSPEETLHAASRTEMFKCPTCEQVTRFPRYNDVQKLLETRAGRCGEWANAFLLVCRAAGLPVRYVLDVTDHVWTEFYSDSANRWVHLDACECAYDQPLLYEAGWGKQLSYVFALGTEGVSDVTKRYTRTWPQLVLRRDLDERWLSGVLDNMTAALRSNLDENRSLVLQARDLEQQLEFLGSSGPLSDEEASALPGRQTGSAEWRSARGETGQQVGGASASAAAPKPSATPYRLTADRRLPQLFVDAGRITAGAVKASGENGNVQACEMALDGRVSSKWLDFGGGGVGGTAWLEYRLLKEAPAVMLTHYDLVSAEDCPERDPWDWVVEGVTQDDVDAGKMEVWTTLHKRSGVDFTARNQLRSFCVSPLPPRCRRLRLRITRSRDPAAANSVQLACWNIYSAPFPHLAAREAAESGKQDPAAGPSVSGTGSGAATVDERLVRDWASRVIKARASKVLDGPSGVKLLTVLRNLQRHPRDPKFGRVRASKVATLLTNSDALALMLAVGFRPVIASFEEAAAAGVSGSNKVDDVALLMGDGGPEVLRRVAAAVHCLEAAGFDEAAAASVAQAKAPPPPPAPASPATPAFSPTVGPVQAAAQKSPLTAAKVAAGVSGVKIKDAT